MEYLFPGAWFQYCRFNISRIFSKTLLHLPRLGRAGVVRAVESKPRSTIVVGPDAAMLHLMASGALAYAMPYEGTQVVVFYDRLEKTVAPGRRARLLQRPPSR